MNRPLLRGSSTGDANRLKEDNSLQMQLNGNANEDSRLHGEFVGSPQALRLMMRHISQEQPAAGSFLSPCKTQHRLSDNGLVNGTRNTDCLTSPDLPSLNSSAQCVEMGRTNSILSASSGQVRNRRGLAIPLGTSMILCFMSVFVIISILGSGGPVRTLRLVPTLGMYRSYRRLQQEVVLDPFKGGIFGQGTVRLKELRACQGILEEDYVPCYNSSLSYDTAFRYAEEYDRHCGLPARRKPCLTQPPDDYKVPLRWPASRDCIWGGNMKFNDGQMSLTGMRTSRLIPGEDGLIALGSDAEMGKYAQQVANMIGVDGDGSLDLAGVHTVLDINCGLSHSGGSLFSENILTLCIGPYVTNGSQVQFALERGLPAMIGSLNTRQFPFSSSSFDAIHCFECGFDWTWKDGILILELDRILRPGGYFIWTSPLVDSAEALSSNNEQDGNSRRDLASRLCWSFWSQSDQTVVWKKTMNHSCYFSRDMEASPKMCGRMHDTNSTWYPLLRSCIVGSTHNDGNRASRKKFGHDYLASSGLRGFSNEELSDDSHIWSMMVKSYWSLFSPLIFSDHPKRPGQEDPLTPSNIVRNVMDMNAVHGDFNAALLETGKSVWVMNVVPLSGPDTLSTIYHRGLVGVLHDWCEAFPTYPRTYDLLHAIGLLSQESERSNKCGLSSLFLEMDRILRPEGWVILRDKVELIEDARIAAGQMKWESRIVEVEGVNDFQLLVCQKTFWKNFSKNLV